MVSKNTDSSVGKRIRDLRNASGYSRRDFSERHHMPEATLKSWELNISEISERMLLKLLNAFSVEGIYTSKEWILQGKGGEITSPPEDIKVEETDFRTMILEDSHAPYLNKGDQIYGKQILLEALPEKKPTLCIVKKAGVAEPFIGIFTKSEDQNLNFVSLNTLLVESINKEDVEKIYLPSWIQKK